MPKSAQETAVARKGMRYIYIMFILNISNMILIFNSV